LPDYDKISSNKIVAAKKRRLFGIAALLDNENTTDADANDGENDDNEGERGRSLSLHRRHQIHNRSGGDDGELEKEQGVDQGVTQCF
jgi:hypothetical protein